MTTNNRKSWEPGGREKAIEELKHDGLKLTAESPEWDLVVIGGGITGAGVFREATRRNLKVLLVERKDFAWGTSSKSSKMVHGGLRYLGSGQFGLTRDSVNERQRLMTEVPGLVDPLNFLMGHYKLKFPGPRIFNLLLTIYDWMAGKRNHRYFKGDGYSLLAPGLNSKLLSGVTQFGDAVTDDARLVMRVLSEGIREGGVALNYVSAKEVKRDGNRVTGLVLQDEESNECFEVKCKAVVNATGAWTDQLRAQTGADTVIRPLRGSHLVFPLWRLPVSYSVSFFHPQDHRPVFLFPWEGVAVAGTTDLDHKLDGRGEIAITQQEVNYLLEGINAQFPGAAVSEDDAIASYAGVRPVVGTGALNPSNEKREHSIWDDAGMISVAGGKLTTFRLIALDVLKEVARYIPELKFDSRDATIFKDQATTEWAEFKTGNVLSKTALRRLSGRYGSGSDDIQQHADNADLVTIRTTDTLWAEIDWVLQNESIVHLEDLMLRRTRLGLLLPEGGKGILLRLKPKCQAFLGWNEPHWEREVITYLKVWQSYYSLPKYRNRIITGLSGILGRQSAAQTTDAQPAQKPLIEAHLS